MVVSQLNEVLRYLVTLFRLGTAGGSCSISLAPGF